MQTLLFLFAAVLGPVTFFAFILATALERAPLAEVHGNLVTCNVALAALFGLFRVTLFVPDNFLDTQKSGILTAVSAAVDEELLIRNSIFLVGFCDSAFFGLAPCLPG